MALVPAPTENEAVNTAVPTMSQSFTSTYETAALPDGASRHWAAEVERSVTRFPAVPERVSVPVTVCVFPPSNWTVFPAAIERFETVVSPVTTLVVAGVVKARAPVPAMDEPAPDVRFPARESVLAPKASVFPAANARLPLTVAGPPRVRFPLIVRLLSV